MPADKEDKSSILLGPAAGLLKRLPGGDLVNEQLNKAEDFLVDQIADRIGDRGLPLLPAPGSHTRQRRMAELLEQAENQKLDDAKGYLFDRILAQLVPDEVRIIGALSDGNGHAMIHVAAGPPVGPILRREMENISNVGRAAGVMWVEMTQFYIQHLRKLGVCETAPEDESLEVKYEVLQGDKAVREMVKRIEGQFGMTGRFLRRTLVLSPLGMELWQRCLPENYR